MAATTPHSLFSREPSGVGTAVLYARVSSKEQERGGFSIPAQQHLLRTYADEHGLSVAAEFVDVETAGRAGRPGFEAMLAHLEKNRDCRTVLVEKTDRLYRNLRDWVTLDELGLEVHLVKEGAVLSEDSVSSEKFVHGIKVLVAKNFLDNLSEETRKGMREKARQGMWPSHAPLGYRNIEGPHGKRIIAPDPDIGPLVAQLFEWYATGEVSLTELTRRAENAGLRTRKSHRPVPRSQIHAMLRAPIYMGQFDWKGVRYAGRHTPLVPRDVWDEVQDILSGRAPRRRPARVKRDFAFSGVVHCGTCAADGLRFLLVGEIKKERYVYYRCEECKRRRRAVYVREEVIARAFVDTWTDAARDPVVSDAITAAAVLASDGDDQGPALELAEVLAAFQEPGNTGFRRSLVERLHSNSVWAAGSIRVEWRNQQI